MTNTPLSHVYDSLRHILSGTPSEQKVVENANLLSEIQAGTKGRWVCYSNTPSMLGSLTRMKGETEYRITSNNIAIDRETGRIYLYNPFLGNFYFYCPISKMMHKMLTELDCSRYFAVFSPCEYSYNPPVLWEEQTFYGVCDGRMLLKGHSGGFIRDGKFGDFFAGKIWEPFGQGRQGAEYYTNRYHYHAVQDLEKGASGAWAFDGGEKKKIRPDDPFIPLDLLAYPVWTTEWTSAA